MSGFVAEALARDQFRDAAGRVAHIRRAQINERAVTRDVAVQLKRERAIIVIRLRYR